MLTAPDILRLQRSLLAWYRKHQRDLPWRRTGDPYRIWVSEVTPPDALLYGSILLAESESVSPSWIRKDN